MIATGQLILGTDKRNALFTVYEWEEDEGEEQLHVYYGLELLEVVPADRKRSELQDAGGSALQRRIEPEGFARDLQGRSQNHSTMGSSVTQP